jgi:chromate transport protein ChrA
VATNSSFSRSHSFGSLFLLYGTSVIAMLPFAFAYAYLVSHRWERNSALALLLIPGVIVAHVVWALAERRLAGAATQNDSTSQAVPNWGSSTKRQVKR